MLLDLFFEMRRRKIPVATTEWLALMRALALGLHESSLDGLYHLSRAVLVKDLAHYDAFDAAFLSVFKGVTASAAEITRQLLDWLENPANARRLTEEERQVLRALSLEELRRLFEERLREQKERHDGGSHYIGTRGTSPFGRLGAHPTGLRLGEGGQRTAVQVAEERRFREYRRDAVLDVRRVDVALRLLRDLGRDGAPVELDLPESIARTARNAGELEVVSRPERRNRTKVLLLMDVGGSMDPYARLVEQLFTAASRTGRFARFRHLYFHNCIYDQLYADASFREDVPVADLLASTDRDEKVVLVGDAAMAPGELFASYGAHWGYSRLAGSRAPGFEWMKRIAGHFRRSAWLNPSPEPEWSLTTVRALGALFPMFPLTLDGLSAAVRQLIRGGAVGASP
jgi:uncharacterized protein with von Willebrand factor type A (vWA) domain